MTRSHFTRLHRLAVGAMILAGTAAPISAQVTISRFSFDCGGSTVAVQGQPGVLVTGVMGQPDAGPPLTGPGGITLRTGFLVPVPTCIGDTNGDNQINGADLSVLLGQFGQNVTAGSGSDFNGDGLVNGADLSVLLGRFGLAC